MITQKIGVYTLKFKCDINLTRNLSYKMISKRLTISKMLSWRIKIMRKCTMRTCTRQNATKLRFRRFT